jgi:hypothetical protein
MQKVILHAHSIWSHDSNITLKEWISVMRKNKVNKVYLTEHEESGWSEAKYEDFKNQCAFYSTNEYKLVPGLELNIDGYHVLAPGLINYSNRPNKLKDLKLWVESQGSTLIMAHPTKYKKIPNKILHHCSGIEVKNTKPQYNWFVGPTMNTIKLAKKFNLDHYVGQDVHKLNQINKNGYMLFDSDKKTFISNVKYNYNIFYLVINTTLLHSKNLLISVYVKTKNITSSRRRF